MKHQYTLHELHIITWIALDHLRRKWLARHRRVPDAVQLVFDHGGEQVVGGADRVNVTRQMQSEFITGSNRAATAPPSTVVSEMNYRPPQTVPEGFSIGTPTELPHSVHEPS